MTKIAGPLLSAPILGRNPPVGEYLFKLVAWFDNCRTQDFIINDDYSLTYRDYGYNSCNKAPFQNYHNGSLIIAGKQRNEILKTFQYTVPYRFNITIPIYDLGDPIFVKNRSIRVYGNFGYLGRIDYVTNYTPGMKLQKATHEHRNGGVYYTLYIQYA